VSGDISDTQFYVDLSFAVVFIMVLLMLVATAWRTFKYQNNRDLNYILTVLFMILTLISKFPSHPSSILTISDLTSSKTSGTKTSSLCYMGIVRMSGWGGVS
jgi:hypothetical protein